MQDFKPNLTPLLANWTTCSINNIFQLEYKYIQYTVTCEHLHKIIFKCVCAKNNNIIFIKSQLYKATDLKNRTVEYR